ncbi:MAG TPA: RICIN domain-containing protein [Natronosporangium sp.]
MSRTRVGAALAAVTLVLSASLTTAVPRAQAAPVTVPVGEQFTDNRGAVIHAHGGGIIKVGEFYYWFGENRHPNNQFRAVSVWRSTDLRNWEFRNDALTQASHPELQVSNIERPKVIFNRSTGQYVMWMHKENGSDYSEARAAVAVSNTVDGDYTYLGSFRPFGQHMSRDITAFVDDDGTGYLISAARENFDLHIYRLTPDYTNVAALVANPWPGGHREAPALFKRNGVYFMLTSGATGWSPNQAQYATATNIAGPWSSMRNVADGTTFGSQPAFVLPIQGTQTTSYLYLGDRWAGAWGGPVSDSRYVWLPIAFPSSTSMSMSYARELTIDTVTGQVSTVGTGYHRIVVRHSGMSLDVANNATGNNAAVVQYPWNGGDNQQWRVQSIGNGYYQIVARHSGRCLDVTSASTADGASVIQYTCGSGHNQQWQLIDAGGGYVRAVARHSGKCLDLPSSSQTQFVQFKQYPCNGGQNQQFQLLPL